VARLYLEAGIYRTAAVVGCDAISPLQSQVFLGDPKRVRVRDRMLVYMFGDGAGAIVLEVGGEPGVIGSAVGCVGTGRAPGMEVLGGGGTYAPYAEQREGRLLDLRIDIGQASSFTATLTTTGLRDALERTGVTADTVDLLVTPEADTEWMANAAAAGDADAEIWAAFQSRSSTRCRSSARPARPRCRWRSTTRGRQASSSRAGGSSCSGWRRRSGSTRGWWSTGPPRQPECGKRIPVRRDAMRSARWPGGRESIR
jgi:3-Oxoacyl-[acyl-carrier-protein (ACP)] synthase III